MSDKRIPKKGEYWVVEIRGRLQADAPVEREVVLVYDEQVYSCGSEEGWYRVHHDITFIRKVRL